MVAAITTDAGGVSTNGAIQGHADTSLAAASLLGFWAAVATAATYVTFDVGLLADPLVPAPWDHYVAIGASLLLAPSFLLLTISLHYVAPPAAKIWTHCAMLFATIYAALVSLVYVTWLFVWEPHRVDGTESQVKPFVFDQGSFIQMVDAIGYTFMGFAVFFTAFVFARRDDRWPRRLALASAPAALAAFVSYVTYVFAFGAPAGLITPAYAIVVALYFKRHGAPKLGRTLRLPFVLDTKADAARVAAQDQVAS